MTTDNEIPKQLRDLIILKSNGNRSFSIMVAVMILKQIKMAQADDVAKYFAILEEFIAIKDDL